MTTSRSSKQKTGQIEQTIIFRGVTPHEVYETLIDARRHAAFTGGEALISRRVKGKFTTFDGWASGQQLDLIPDRKIVQTWRTEDWPADALSTCTYVLTLVAGDTKLVFHQAGVPLSFVKNIAKGWHDYYWRPMQQMFDRASAKSR